MYSHLDHLMKLRVVDGHYGTPSDFADALVEKIKERVKRGFAIEL